MRGDTEARLWLVIAASCAAAAVTIDFGNLHRLHNADSFLPVLVSVQHWQPFYWGQDRLGMLLPLLALPVTDPMANLLVQSAGGIFASLLVFFLVPRFARVPHPWLCGVLAAVVFLVACPASLRFDFVLDHQPYGSSMALGIGGALLCERGGRMRRLAGVSLVVLAHWVNVGAWLFLMPLVILRGVLARTPRALVRDLAIVVAGATVGHLLMGLSPIHPTSVRLLPLRAWPAGWWVVASHAWVGSGAWLPVSLVLACGGLIGRARTRRRDGIDYRPLAILVGSALAYGLAVGTMQWIEMNAYHVRYVLPSLVLVTTSLAALGADLFAAPRPRRAAYVVPLLLLGAAVSAYGVPSRRGVRADLAQVGSDGGWAEDVVAAGCTHVAGNYWRVWPTVFYGLLLTHERGENRSLWGLTYRGEDARERWQHLARDRYRICVAPADPEGSKWLATFGLRDFVAVSEAPRLRVLAVAPSGGGDS